MEGMMNQAQNSSGLKTANIVSLAGVLIGYIVLGIFGYAQGLHWIIYVGSIVFSIFNGLFYVISENQRLSIVKNRVFTVYIGALVILFFSAFDALWLILHGFDFMGYYPGRYILYVIMSIAFILVVAMQSITFALMVRRAAELNPGLMSSA